jgi:hypothetical protein
MNNYAVDKVIKNGRKLGLIQRTKPEIRDGCILIGLLIDWNRTEAVDLTEQSEYNHQLFLYNEAIWRRIDLYEVPKERIPECGLT